MAEFQKKKTAVVMKDSNGSLFQAMPETAAEHVSYGNSSLSDELDRQKNIDVAEITQEIETETETVTEQIHEELEGIMRPSDDATGNYFSICFNITLKNTINDYQKYISPYTNSANLGLYNFYDEDNISLEDYFIWSSEYGYRNASIPSNKRYYYDFTLDSDFTANVISMHLYGISFYKNGELDEECPGNVIEAVGSNYVSNSPYSTVEENGYIDGISFEHPEIGSSTIVYFDTWVYYPDEGSLDQVYHEMEHFDKSITIERLSATEYRLSFYWDTIYDSTVERTVTKKKLTTTLEHVDETSSSTSTQISGLLQDVDISTNLKMETEVSQVNGTYHPYVYLGVGGVGGSTPLEH